MLQFVITIEINVITDLSWIEITKLVPSLLMRFDIEMVHPNDEPKQHCWCVTWINSNGIL